MSTIPERLAALRAAMRENSVELYLVPSSDEHLDEYLPPWRLRREFLSGFTGSAGDLLVGLERAWLFVDSRYHLQADLELEGSGIAAVKLGAEGALSLVEHLRTQARHGPGLVLGIDPMVLPLSQAEELVTVLAAEGGVLREVRNNLVDPLWSERPEPPRSVLLQLPLEWCGRTAAQKLSELRRELAECGASATVIIKLDQIAWLLNLRSLVDVPFNPIFEAAMLVCEDSVHLFVHGAEQRLPAGFAAEFAGFHVHPYRAFTEHLGQQRDTRILLDPAGVTRGVAARLEQTGAVLVRAPSPIEVAKACKNSAERDAQRRANLRASVAKTRAVLWLRRELAAGHRVTESSFREHIEARYAEQEDYAGLAFTTISATGPHGAIIHYSQSDETPLEPGQLFLIDSGAHIAGGTSDATRTLAVGPCDAEAQRLYTAVLRGHIAAARQRIPAGTAGVALDTLARAPLWDAMLDYGHGTGHGVGAFLNVHEGPASISHGRPASTLPLNEGLVTSIEPGCYRRAWGGVRLENLYLLVADGEDEEGRSWLRFENLTWIPFDPALIDVHSLLPSEKRWVADYHRECLERLGPLLDEDEVIELRNWIETPAP